MYIKKGIEKRCIYIIYSYLFYKPINKRIFAGYEVSEICRPDIV